MLRLGKSAGPIDPLEEVAVPGASARSRAHGRAIVVWLALVSGACTTATASKDLPIWRVELWNTHGDYLGALLVEVTRTRATGPTTDGGEIGRVLEAPPGVPGIGKEAEVSIGRGQFRMILDLGQVEGMLVVKGEFQGSVASGEAVLMGYVGLRQGTFKARRVS